MKRLINSPISVHRLQRQAGMGLIEVLVSIILLSSVLLGAIGLQLSAAKEQRSAQFVSRAALLASEMGERMRVNRAAVKDGKYTTEVTQAAVKKDIDSAMSTPLKNDCSDKSPCILPDDISKYDVNTWWQNIRTQMPPDSVGMLLATTAGGASILARDIVIAWPEPVTNKDVNNKPILLNNSCPLGIKASLEIGRAHV